MVPIEFIVRGYLAGSGWAEYRRHGTLADESLPTGLLESAELPEPRFTPAIKAESGHDENISRERLANLVGVDRAQQLERVSLELYRAGAAHARR